MSEDNLTIEFTSDKLSEDSYRSNLERIYSSYINHGNENESTIEYANNKAIYFKAFYCPETSTLRSLLHEMEKQGVNDLLATAWYDNVGEKAYFTRVNNQFLEFESREEIAEYMKEINKKEINAQFNYGKPSRENTLLIRLHVKANGKRKKLCDLFSRLLSTPDIESFKAQFVTFIKSDSHDVEWCRFKWKDSGSWNVTCPDELANMVTDVQEIDEYIYIAFNLDNVDHGMNVVIDGFVWFVFSQLDGVKKVWVKYRPRGCDDLYLHYPGMGDESFFVEKEIPNDDDWPKV